MDIVLIILAALALIILPLLPAFTDSDFTWRYSKVDNEPASVQEPKTEIKSDEYYEKEYGVKVVSGYPCGSCAYHYNGVEDLYPHIPGKDRPHPRICINRERCLEDKSKCYVKDML